MPKLTNKLCLVTGAARGIGKAICQAFVDEGARVVATDCDHDEGIAVAAALDCDVAPLDVS